MHCKVCGHDQLVVIEYKTADIAAPALECRRCRAINLDERTAKSEKDLDSVRRALAARQVATDVASGTREVPSGTIRAAQVDAAQVDAALSEIDLLLAQERVALQCLSDLADAEAGKAVADVREIVERVAAIVDDLGKLCAHATNRGSAASTPERPAGSRPAKHR